MNRRTLAARAACVGGLALAGLTGCSLAPKLPQPAVFDLGPPPADVMPSALHLRIADAGAPPWLADAGIGYRLAFKDPFRREIYRDSRWAAAPAALLTQRLQLRLAGRSCNSPANAEPPQLKLSLEEFSQVFDSPTSARVVLRLRARLDAGPLSGRTPDRLFTVQVASPTADAAGAVRGLASATDQVLGDVLTWTAGALPGTTCP